MPSARSAREGLSNCHCLARGGEHPDNAEPVLGTRAMNSSCTASFLGEASPPSNAGNFRLASPLLRHWFELIIFRYSTKVTNVVANETIVKTSAEGCEGYSISNGMIAVAKNIIVPQGENKRLRPQKSCANLCILRDSQAGFG